MFPRSSRSFSSDLKLLYGVISVFYVQSQVLRPPFFFTTSYRITRRLEPGVTWYLFSCLRVQTEKKKESRIANSALFRQSRGSKPRSHVLILNPAEEGFFIFSSHALDARTCRHTHPSAWISINCSRTM